MPNRCHFCLFYTTENIQSNVLYKRIVPLYLLPEASNQIPHQYCSRPTWSTSDCWHVEQWRSLLLTYWTMSVLLIYHFPLFILTKLWWKLYHSLLNAYWTFKIGIFKIWLHLLYTEHTEQLQICLHAHTAHNYSNSAKCKDNLMSTRIIHLVIN